jgi:hypothetical protein
MISLKTLDKISECRARIEDLRKRAAAEADPGFKAELRTLELQWLTVLESYEVIVDRSSFLNGVRARRSALQQKVDQAGSKIVPRKTAMEFTNGSSLGDLLEVLVWTAVEHADSKARAAFYLSDAAELELNHIVGMPPEYARCERICDWRTVVGVRLGRRDTTADHYARREWRATLEGMGVVRQRIRLSRVLVVSDRDFLGQGPGVIRDVLCGAARSDSPRH